PIFRKKITEEAVLGCDFVMFDAAPAGSIAGDFPARNPKTPHVTVRASSMQFIEALVLQSDMLGNVARNFARASLESGELREVPTKLMGRIVRAGILSREGSVQTQAMRVLKAELSKASKT